MGDNNKLKFGIDVVKLYDKSWSFCIGVSHDGSSNETYLWINFFRWTISIGKLYKYD